MWWLNLEPSDESFTAESFHPMIHELARKVEPRSTGSRSATSGKKDLENEITRFIEVYNSAWEKNWGFVPITEEEVRAQAADLKPVMDERWGFIAERDGEVLGAALTLPDCNQVISKMNGRLLPFGWASSCARHSARWGSTPRRRHRPRPRLRPRSQARVPAPRHRGRASTTAA